jgi:hypothetical protein
METGYSADAVASARSLQTYTVRHFLLKTRAIDACTTSTYAVRAIFTRLFLVLTHLSIDGYVLGGLLPMYFCPMLNSLCPDLRLCLFDRQGGNAFVHDKLS